MADEHHEDAQSIEDLYALIEQNRLADELVAERIFQNEVNAAINAITEISAVASSRIMTDTQVASAKIQIDAEVVAARLAAGAEIAISGIKAQGGTQSKANVKAAIYAIGDGQTTQVMDTARHSIHQMVTEAEAAIAKLRQLADAAIEEIHRYATNTTERMQATVVAANRMKAFRAEEHSRDEIVAEGTKAAIFVSQAAEASSRVVQENLEAALKNIRATTDQACANIKASVEKAVERIEAARLKAQARIEEAVRRATT
ncbi:hypothetical protein A6A04_15855 [Paramagnetospirillum marisnigri]|uniref:Uncharacterized protein n=1 Tax=Paramagnetospirillum marisnigri TaxID=1285242 RepID=A0A178MSP7_9PROT|nr:hypothetical protein [Paramagnetospirillum marisnigri]OAN52771.1 hypothetical protein A6A04_15855 [Paramagnetospirillum marisnigri]